MITVSATAMAAGSTTAPPNIHTDVMLMCGPSAR